jgi:hypothetical protein
MVNSGALANAFVSFLIDFSPVTGPRYELFTYDEVYSTTFWAVKFLA